MINSGKCLVCDSDRLEYLTKLFSKHCKGLVHNVSICRDCGHIQLSPLIRAEEFSKINEDFLGGKYLKGGVENPDNDKKLDKISRILSPYIANEMKILDIGAGEGWMMKLAEKWQCKYFAIEPIPKLADSIVARGGEVISNSISDNLDAYLGAFDIVVFRHVLEHMECPLDVLLKIKRLLKPEGVLYIAVPNASDFSIRKGVRTSFLRPAHLSYFCKGNLTRLARRAGLIELSSDIASEIVCILRPSDGKLVGDIEENYYEGQRKTFKARIQASLFRDTYNIMCIVIIKLLDRKSISSV